MTETAAFLGSFLVRGTVLLALALVATILLRRRSAALRHHIWVIAGAGALLLPALTAALPDWTVELPLAPAIATEAIPAQPASEPEAAINAGSATTGLPALSPVVERADGGIVAGTPVPWTTLAGALWLTGFLFFAARLATGIGSAARLSRAARPVEDARWHVLVSHLSLRAGLGRDVRIVQSEHVDVPMAWGLLGRWLILPAGMEHWDEDRRRVVVLHELAHLRRRDCLAQAIVGLAAAIHWPNPLAWLALARLKTEREKACDDSVLQAGTRGSAYARHLVEVARDLGRPRPELRAAVAMARASDLEERVVAILDSGRPRDAVDPRSARLGLLSALAMVVPLGIVQPVAVAPVVPVSVDEVPSPVVTMSQIVVSPKAVGEAEAAVETVREPAPQTVPTVTDTIEERVYLALVRALQSSDPRVRRQAAGTFGQIESPRAVVPLVGALADTDAGVREKAAWALGMIEDPSAVHALVGILDDANGEVREKAAWALGMIESPSAVPGLAGMLADGDPVLREQAAWSLGMIESSDGVAPLLPLLGDESAAVREQVAWALGMIESSDAVEGLASAFRSEDSAVVREQIIWALGMIEDRDALDVVVDAIEDPDADVRDQALWALGMIMS